MAFKIYGLAMVPKTPVITEKETRKGYFLRIDMATTNPKDKKAGYVYTINVWVPKEEKEGFVQKLTPYSIWSIESGVLSMWTGNQDSKPRPSIHVRYDDLVKLKRPVWYPEKEKDHDETSY